MRIEVRQAVTADAESVSSILVDAASWLTAREIPMWRASELLPERLAADVEAGLFFLAEVMGEPVGTIKFQLQDSEFWPEAPADDSAFVHRLAVRRQFGGGVVSSSMLSWARARATSLGRRYLRLDCEASRPRLRAVYERFGFRHHSNRQVGSYFVARYEIDLQEFR